MKYFTEEKKEVKYINEINRNLTSDSYAMTCISAWIGIICQQKPKNLSYL